MKTSQSFFRAGVILAIVLIQGCSAPSIAMPVFTAIIPSATSTAPQEIPLQSVSVTPSQCASDNVDLNVLANIDAFDEYRFSRDSQTIFLRSGSSWLTYSTLTREVMAVSRPEIDLTPTLTPVEQTYRSLLGADYQSYPYLASLAPSRKRLLYWTTVNRLPTPVVTPTFVDVANEDAGWVTESREDIFLLQDGSPEPVFLGKVQGLIKDVHWSQSESRVVIEMLNFSPDFLWLLDIPSKTLKPLLSSEDLPDVIKLGFWGVSPDGNWAMYNTGPADRHNFSILNIDTAEVQEFYQVKRARGAWWTSDSKRIVLAIDAGPGYVSIYIYNLHWRRFTRLLSDLPSEGTSELMSISNHTAVLTYTITDYDSNTYRMSALQLCWDE